MKTLPTQCEAKRITRGYVVTKSAADFGPRPGLEKFQTAGESTAPQIMRIPEPLLCYRMGATEHMEKEFHADLDLWRRFGGFLRSYKARIANQGATESGAIHSRPPIYRSLGNAAWSSIGPVSRRFQGIAKEAASGESRGPFAFRTRRDPGFTSASSWVHLPGKGMAGVDG